MPGSRATPQNTRSWRLSPKKIPVRLASEQTVALSTELRGLTRVSRGFPPTDSPYRGGTAASPAPRGSVGCDSLPGEAVVTRLRQLASQYDRAMRAAVIGGGLLGTLTAVALADRGARVTLYEARPRLLGGASSVGEGKIHLGLVYALGDPRTAMTMLNGALTFDTALETLLGRPLDWATLRGETFEYLVAEDSLVSAEEFIGHAERLEEHRRGHLEMHPDATYLGQPLASCAVEPVDSSRRRFQTHERHLDVRELSETILTAVDERRSLTVEVDTAVRSASPCTDGWLLETARPGDSDITKPYDVVVNCAWEDAARLDRLAGVEAATPNLRLRTFLHGRVRGPAAALTIVHGPYGDVVIRPGGTFYASWYPTGLLGFAVCDAPPDEWQSALDDPAVRRRHIESTLDNLRPLVPQLDSAFDVEVRARIVVAEGATDIADPASALHRRHEEDVVSSRGWISPRARKLTTIPSVAIATVREATREKA